MNLRPWIIAPALVGAATVSAGYEKAFPATANKLVEVKTLPACRVMTTHRDGDYFANADKLFIQLFKYISQNKVAMTIPVQADVKGSSMLFFVGSKDKDRVLPKTDAVTVQSLPERLVASLGARGTYSQANFRKMKLALEIWLRDYGTGCQAAGDAYAVYWDSPFKLWFLKRYEVHIPVVKTATGTPPAK